MNINFDEISDEDFLKMQEAPIVEDEEQQGSEEQQEQQKEPNPDQSEDQDQNKDDQQTDDDADERGAEGDEEEGKKEEVADQGEQSDDEIEKTEPKAVVEKKAVQEKPAEDEKAKKPKEPVKEKVEPEKEAPAINYEAEFSKLVGTPIKANGKEIVLKSADEALRLIQQGAGYNQKMEQLKPARKSAAMLENAGLLGDEQALSHMIDLYDGKPEALARLIKERKIDIFNLDMDSGDKYTPTSHLQSDEAVNFQDTLKEVRTLEGGQEALTLIDKMDDQSKKLLWGNSQAIRELYEYKQSGVYDRVATEVERRKTLGMIRSDTPFIVAFQQVGTELGEEASKAAAQSTAVEEKQDTPKAEPAKPAQRTPVASQPAPRKPVVQDSRAAAAAPPRSGTGAAKPQIDIFSLSDADFEKMQQPPA